MNIKIIGAGPTGSILGLSLASLGINVDIYETIPLNILSNNDRSYALTHSSRRLFQRINIWKDIERVTSPFNSLSIHDSSLNVSKVFDLYDLSLDNLKHQAIGWIVDHKSFMQVLLTKISQSDYINVINQSTSILDNYNYDFSFAADGKFSSSRDLLNIKSASFKYSQACITCRVLLRGAKPFRAYEILRSEGPLAILPLKDDVYQIIWSSSLDLCKKRMNLSRSIFLDNLCTALPKGIEPDSITNKPHLSEVEFLLSFRMFKKNNILLGESVHSIHPVGGQGLNLSIRDINQIINLLQKKKENLCKYNSLVRSFSKQRYLDVLITSLFTDSIIRIFSNKNPFLMIFRKLLFVSISNIKILRLLILSIMTDGIYHLPSALKNKDL